MNCKHPTLYVLGPENKPAPYGYCMLCEVARLTADIATLERRERSRNNRIAELEDALPVANRIRHSTTGFQFCAKCRDIRLATKEQIVSAGECGLCRCANCGSHQCAVKTRSVLLSEGVPMELLESAS